jgi:hypothetical protein
MHSGRSAIFQVGFEKDLESRDQQDPCQFFCGRSYRWPATKTNLLNPTMIPTVQLYEFQRDSSLTCWTVTDVSV